VLYGGGRKASHGDFVKYRTDSATSPTSGSGRPSGSSVSYAKVREQSGRPIGAFQAIQHHCADVLRHVEGSRYILYKAAWRMHAGLECATDVAMAKAHVSDACL
jgi:alkylation response protein AidB-like acyl-CoA dehydrogenase